MTTASLVVGAVAHHVDRDVSATAGSPSRAWRVKTKCWQRESTGAPFGKGNDMLRENGARQERRPAIERDGNGGRRTLGWHGLQVKDFDVVDAICLLAKD
ncbi:MAG TPA: hypothetical protein PKJ45_02660 [Rubrivivax sp.]|nr:hypothetical protein [Rubrivivax sp.]